MSVLTKEVDIATPIDELALDANADRDLWLLFLFRGITLVLFGFTAVVWPAITLVALAWVFSVYILIIGVLDIINGFRTLHSRNLWFLKVLLGVAEIGVGLYLLRANFVVTTLLFLQAAGLILILQAIVDSVVAFRSNLGKGLIVLTLISALFGFIIGVLLVRQPVTTGLTFVWFLGFYGLIVGAMTIAAAFAARPPKTT